MPTKCSPLPTILSAYCVMPTYGMLESTVVFGQGGIVLASIEFLPSNRPWCRVPDRPSVAGRSLLKKRCFFSLRDRRSPKAFRGELTADWRAANPDLIITKNSAEALLAKIKAEREVLKPKKKTRAKKTSHNRSS